MDVESVQGMRLGGRRIRLLWLIDSLAMGGAERLVVSFARSLNRERFDLRVCCLKTIDGNPIAAELERAGVSATVLGARHLRDVAAFRRLVRHVRDQNFDLIHTHLTYADVWGRLAGWLTGRPVVSTVHVPRFFNYISPKSRDRLVDTIATHTRRHLGGMVLAVSEALRRDHISGGFPAKQITAIHNGIEVAQYDPPAESPRASWRTQLGIPANAPVVVTLAVLREGKGHHTLLAAVPMVLQQKPETKFLIVGGGPLEGTLRDHVRNAGLSENVIFTGTCPDARRMLAVADVSVLPSEHDPLPTVILESMAMRLPVIGMHSGGVPEMIVDGQTGLLVAPTDPSALSEAILALLRDPARARQMGERGRSRVEREFSASGWARKLEAVYDEILSRKPESAKC
jgi:glycosyltransferase involved in cell wall biosynthesis